MGIEGWVNEFIQWFGAPKLIGTVFAIGTVSYLFVITTRHHREFWDGIKGDDGKLQFIEAALTIWLVLFTAAGIADFAFGLVGSERFWWGMDSVFLVGSGARTVMQLNRRHKPNGGAEPPSATAGQS